VNPRARPSAKAIIIEDSKLLVITNRGSDGEEFFILPGGGQDALESLPEALRRECLEEIGAAVEVGALLYVRDYIARNHEFKNENPEFHGLELMFECRLIGDGVPGVGSLPDEFQTGVRWVPLEQLGSAPLYPKILRELLPRGDRSPVYLGDVN
jgi:8-oxo-dGTP diphosphatase